MIDIFTLPTEFPAEKVTRDGSRAKLLSYEVGWRYVLAGVVYNGDCDWSLHTWTKDGDAIIGIESGHDLFDIPQVKSRRFNVYPTEYTGSWRESRREADNNSHEGRLYVAREDTHPDGSITIHMEGV